MNLIFVGFLVMLLGIEVNGVSLAPLFQIGGYVLVMQGTRAVDKNNPQFKQALPLIYVVLALNALTFVLSVLKINILATLVGLATLMISVMAVYFIIKGIQVYHDQLSTKELTTKLFKRWRLAVLLFTAMMGMVMVVLALLLTSVTFESFIDLISQLLSNPTSEVVIAELLEPLLPYAGPVLGISVLMMVLAMTGMVFYIMFLVSLYKVQKEFALRTPIESAPTDFPNPQ